MTLFVLPITILYTTASPHAKPSSNSEHLPAHATDKAIHHSRVPLYLPRVQQNLQSARLRRQLEQSLPLVLWQERLFRQRPTGILRFPLSLPRRDFGLFSSQTALVVLVVVQFRVMCLDAVEEKIGGFGKKGVDAEIQSVEVGEEGKIGGCGLLDGRKVGRKLRWR